MSCLTPFSVFAQSYQDPVVSLPNQGNIQGVFSNNLAVFKGIPYAMPPIGTYRWMPPQPTKKWQEIKKATDFGPSCPQLSNNWDKDPQLFRTNEDCLYLNIWAPRSYFEHPNQQHTYPVMVWIHGGGFVSGSGSLDIYNGAALAQRGIVVVTINYRLGRFGFFAHPALKKENEEDKWANYGLLDQIFALQWIQRNIASFGGDSNNVTVFGESAGGASIIALMTITEAKGLFNKAIIQSGTGHNRAFPPISAEKAEAIGVNFASKHHITGNGAQSLEQLRALPTDKIVDGLNLQNFQSDLFSGLVVDNTTLRETLDDAFKNDHFYPVPTLIGDTDGDGLILSATSLDDLAKTLNTTVDEINKIYNPIGKNSQTKVLHQVVADLQIIEPTRLLARQIAQKQTPVYRYRFSYIANVARPYTSFGAPHASEIPYIFNTLNKVYTDITPQDTAMSKAVMMTWVNFAKNGIPHIDGFPDFPSMQSHPEGVYNFKTDGIIFEKDSFKSRLDFIERQLDRKMNKEQNSPTQNNRPKYPTR
ncbi:carboxylesterase/lipase family protein [Commensalibacter oyaizuii]|uniref:Carboxylic ester hydrolase n=1 Tax=Commensalibacter oyaizuii TaxID=3043873 RepID=A0ABT6Q147_9PROT|nr:carboxylesterase family protein [Commensalibacter sp. TBRC 16381]MDI2090194.1 carboxylesterase family protein [Commensalibacter sp. TBRC 16381]